jgi:hypothetical protein
VYVERMVGAGGEPIRLETLVGRLLGEVTVPEPGARYLELPTFLHLIQDSVKFLSA